VAYAIIEPRHDLNGLSMQKPQELRNFLEEAARISQYRERRQETSLRLVETRKNSNTLRRYLPGVEKSSYSIWRYKQKSPSNINCCKKNCTYHSLIMLQRKDEAINQRTHAEKEIQKLEAELETVLSNQRNAEKEYEETRAKNMQLVTSCSKYKATLCCRCLR